MPYNPKTPARHHRSRSETKTPLTPSLASGRNQSPTKSLYRKKSQADITNPFIDTYGSRDHSRAGSPIKNGTSSKRSTSPIKKVTSVGSGAGIPVSKSLRKQASVGLIRKGGVESRIDVVKRDYVPPPATSSGTQTQVVQPRSEGKRSKSQPAVRPVNTCSDRIRLTTKLWLFYFVLEGHSRSVYYHPRYYRRCNGST